MTYIDKKSRMSFRHLARLRQHFSSARPLFGRFLRIDPYPLSPLNIWLHRFHSRVETIGGWVAFVSTPLWTIRPM